MIKIIFLFIGLSLFNILSIGAQDLDLIKELEGTSSHIDGPNCWNGALYVVGVVDHKRFYHPNEWLSLLEKNCHEIKGEPITGDVGRLFIEDTEVHGFVHIDSDLIFAKHGQATKDGYQLMSYGEMLEQYERTRSCRMRNSFESECFHELKYYRCEKKENYEPLKVALFTLLERILFDEETKKSYREGCDEGSFIEREKLLKKILIILEEMKEKGVNLREEGESLVTQFYDLEVSNRSYRCSRQEKRRSVKKVKDAIRELMM